jgi:tetratricopeptide (TPR) repeat protein
VTPRPSGNPASGGQGRRGPQRAGSGRGADPSKARGRPERTGAGRGKAPRKPEPTGGRSGGDPNKGRGAIDPGKDRSRSTAGRWRRDELPAEARTSVQAEYDGPPIPEDITGQEVDRGVSNALKSLPEKLATRVAKHLVAAGRLMDSDPDTAYQHTVAARARAARVAIVREACGEAAYASGRFKEALSEFKAARRMSGTSIYLAMMADSERALGRPERAIALAKDPGVVDLDEAGQIELKIVESGARRDLGDHAAAIRTLEGRELRSRSRESWVPRLRYAYAEALLADGQRSAALEWFERAAGIDAEGYTDAAERVAELEGLVVIDTVDPDGDTD